MLSLDCEPKCCTQFLVQQLRSEGRLPPAVLCRHCQHTNRWKGTDIFASQGCVPNIQLTNQTHMWRVDATTFCVRIKRLLSVQLFIKVTDPHASRQDPRSIIYAAVRPEAQKDRSLPEDVLLLAAASVLEATAAVVAVREIHHRRSEALPAEQLCSVDGAHVQRALDGGRRRSRSHRQSLTCLCLRGSSSCASIPIIGGSLEGFHTAERHRLVLGSCRTRALSSSLQRRSGIFQCELKSLRLLHLLTLLRIQGQQPLNGRPHFDLCRRHPVASPRRWRPLAGPLAARRRWALADRRRCCIGWRWRPCTRRRRPFAFLPLDSLGGFCLCHGKFSGNSHEIVWECAFGRLRCHT
mmetsp:Transcript_70898/g.129730  ORF Transcript_70898/g.129730 Transcript_70898/m.129730 type:complete len:352 (+) Transcript_70898:290-1345(+)